MEKFRFNGSGLTVENFFSTAQKLTSLKTNRAWRNVNETRDKKIKQTRNNLTNETRLPAEKKRKKEIVKTSSINAPL